MSVRTFLLFLCVISVSVYAQTTPVPDSVSGRTSAFPADSLRRDSLPVVVKRLSWQEDTAFNRFFINRNLPRNKQSVYAINDVRQPSHQDDQFYILSGLLLFTGIVRALFPKYFTTLSQSFLQSSMRQRQSKESIAQDALPSFLLNLVFIFSGGLLLATFIKGDDLSRNLPFPLLWLYASAVLAVIYTAKSLFITFMGWSFNVEAAAGSYRSVVFLVNKIAGLCFIPLLLVLVYATGDSFNTLATIAISVVVILLLYRYVVSLGMIGKNLKIHPFHFFLYLCAVEILPLLITYKMFLITKEL